MTLPTQAGRVPMPAHEVPVPDNKVIPEAVTSFELVVRARAGDEKALNDLCARYLPRLQRWATGRLPAGDSPNSRKARYFIDLGGCL